MLAPTLALVLAGCAESERSVEAPDQPESFDWALAGEQAPTPDGARSRIVASEPESRWRVRSLAAPPLAKPPPGRRGRLDVRFSGAELTEALRLLAEAGGFALVTEGTLGGSVTAELHHVRAYDALVSLAEAHGASVERRGDIVIVSARGAPAQSRTKP